MHSCTTIGALPPRCRIGQSQCWQHPAGRLPGCLGCASQTQISWLVLLQLLPPGVFGYFRQNKLNLLFWCKQPGSNRHTRVNHSRRIAFMLCLHINPARRESTTKQISAGRARGFCHEPQTCPAFLLPCTQATQWALPMSKARPPVGAARCCTGLYTQEGAAVPHPARHE